VHHFARIHADAGEIAAQTVSGIESDRHTCIINQARLTSHI
jgi:hypothetical protein